MRSPSDLSDSSLRPSFLRTTPAKNPRTECCCQPVAFMMAAMVVPPDRLSRPITSTCLELARDLGWRALLASAAFDCLLRVDAAFALWVRLGLVILDSIGGNGIMCRHHRCPAEAG